ncbi:hypothetical protein [Streptomyces sp. 6N106]|uniref:hypothetical protein n=1 Tax=Streptomyces sp. 6N106 TaxID=3457418 RepID=UPI003FD5450B
MAKLLVFDLQHLDNAGELLHLRDPGGAASCCPSECSGGVLVGRDDGVRRR